MVTVKYPGRKQMQKQQKIDINFINRPKGESFVVHCCCSCRNKHVEVKVLLNSRLSLELKWIEARFTFRNDHQ